MTRLASDHLEGLRLLERDVLPEIVAALSVLEVSDQARVVLHIGEETTVVAQKGDICRSMRKASLFREAAAVERATCGIAVVVQTRGVVSVSTATLQSLRLLAPLLARVQSAQPKS